MLSNKRFWILVGLVLLLISVLSFRFSSKPPISSGAAGTNSITSTNYSESIKGNKISHQLSKVQAVAQYLEDKRFDQDYDWKRPIEFYGRVVDQHGKPIPEAKVRIQWSDLSKRGASETNIVTGENGAFSLVGVKGKGLSVFLTKDGYSRMAISNQMNFEYADPSIPWFHKPDPRTPVQFTLFRHSPPDKLVFGNEEKTLKHDGSDTVIPLKEEVQNIIGPLIIRSRTEKRTEEKLDPDWSVEIELRGGLLKPTNELFPSLAPEEGYALTFHRDETFGAETWSSRFDQTFYFKTLEPIRYGKMRISFLVWGRNVTVNYWINPSGERGLSSGSN